MQTTLSSRIRALRKENHLTQAQLAKTINVSHSTLSQYESGARRPNYHLIASLADVFCVSIDYLLGKNENRQSAAALSHCLLLPREIQLLDQIKAKDPQLIEVVCQAASIPGNELVRLRKITAVFLSSLPAK
ncbi:MAG: helix-turn-helix domain-containing protein [Christensenellales bacterium]|jgi:transcriptional regulator with XRE-family HTH domain